MIEEHLQKYLDIEDGLNRIRGNRVLFKTLLGTYVKNNYYDQLRNEIEGGDYQTASRTAHTMKGLAGNLSMPVLYEASLQLEQELKAGSPTEESLGQIAEVVEKTMQAVAAAIDSL